MGIVNTSYYVRGQYTLLDTLPLARTFIKLWPVVETSGDATSPTTGNDTGEPPPTPAPAETTGDDILRDISSTPNPSLKSKEDYIPAGKTFPFVIPMPTHHYHEANVELPPSCQVFQVGMQAGVEYVMRVKLIRKKWRLNERYGLSLLASMIIAYCVRL
jgi:hypothetical protein